MHSQRVDHNQILQGKLAKIRQHHTTFTGYISRPQTRTDPSSTAKFAYLTRRNFGLSVASVVRVASAAPLPSALNKVTP